MHGYFGGEIRLLVVDVVFPIITRNAWVFWGRDKADFSCS